VFSISAIKNLKILIYTNNHFKYKIRSPDLLQVDGTLGTLLVSDVFYDGRKNPKRIMDVYYSESRELMPIIILVYSVNWSFDKKEAWGRWARLVQSKGYVVIIPEFTSVADGKLFEMSYDFLKCLQWVSSNGRQFRGDVKKIFVVGVEAGAHLTMHCILDSIFNRMHALMVKNLILPPIYGVVL
jgi:acetyl esterase/lipase